jgi:hypothetical protein
MPMFLQLRAREGKAVDRHSRAREFAPRIWTHEPTVAGTNQAVANVLRQEIVEL